ncbi:hypothetical protein LJB78_00515 [Bacteroidales bacterium OttesenSCG-928-J16]|nr:hypothetical protein [Bacteroidales bacterium OttesenSCG-928-J16]
MKKVNIATRNREMFFLAGDEEGQNAPIEPCARQIFSFFLATVRDEIRTNFKNSSCNHKKRSFVAHPRMTGNHSDNFFFRTFAEKNNVNAINVFK